MDTPQIGCRSRYRLTVVSDFLQGAKGFKRTVQLERIWPNIPN